MGNEPKKQKHMMHRSDFKKLYNLNKKVVELREENDELIEEMCDENAEANWWPDKVNLKAGFVLVELPNTEAADQLRATPRVERQRITPEWRKKLKAKRTEILDALHALERKVTLVAVACCVPTTCIDIGSGEITVEASDVHEYAASKDDDEGTVEGPSAD